MRTVLAAAVLFLGGCGFTGQGDFVRNTIATKGAEAADEGLVNAEWWICTGTSIGSIKRKYGVSVERAHAYNRFCPDTSATSVIQPRDGLPPFQADTLPPSQ